MCVFGMDTLYSKSKTGKVRYWSIAVEQQGDRVFIVRHIGEDGGKDQEFRKEVTSGKNIGKKNETSKLQQAQSEAKSMWTKQLEAGCVTDKNSLDEKVNILPMLANKWEERHKHVSEPFYVQPKLDGVRMLLGKYNGKFLMLSRTGKEVKHMDHIGNEVKGLLKEGEFLDGENYSPNKTFEEITGLCRTTLQSSADGKDLGGIKFFVFDKFNLNSQNETFEVRQNNLKKFFSKKFKNLEMVETKILHSKKFIEAEHDKYVSQGYEGIMIRDRQGKYGLAERSNTLLKFKKFQTEEYEIVGANEGTGKDAGTVVWVCKGGGGLNPEFAVRPTGSLAQRKQWFRSRDQYIGKMLTVKFQNLTEYGFPRFPVGLGIRDYE
jgi:ATP-dependent DNA ligase